MFSINVCEALYMYTMCFDQIYLLHTPPFLSQLHVLCFVNYWVYLVLLVCTWVWGHPWGSISNLPGTTSLKNIDTPSASFNCQYLSWGGAFGCLYIFFQLDTIWGQLIRVNLNWENTSTRVCRQAWGHLLDWWLMCEGSPHWELPSLDRRSWGVYDKANCKPGGARGKQCLRWSLLCSCLEYSCLGFPLWNGTQDVQAKENHSSSSCFWSWSVQ